MRLRRAHVNPLDVVFQGISFGDCFQGNGLHAAGHRPVAHASALLQNGYSLSGNSSCHTPDMCFWGLAFINTSLKTVI